MSELIPVAEVQHALRSVRAAAYSLDTVEAGVTVELVMSASSAGRRNAAERIVSMLGAAGLSLDAPDPVTALTDHRRGLLVLRDRRGLASKP